MSNSSSSTTITLQDAIRIAIDHHKAGRLQAAEAIYRQVLQHQPDYPDALHLLGVVALQIGQYQVAAELIGKAVTVAPSTADYYPNLGEALRNQGRLEEAVAAFQHAIALNPNLVAAYNNLGIVLKQLKRYDEAITACRRAVELNPQHFQALNNLAAACKLNGDIDAAIAYYQQAHALSPENTDILNNLGAALQERGDEEAAIACFRQVRILNPDGHPTHALVVGLQARVKHQPSFVGVDMAGWEDWEERSAPRISVIVCSIDAEKLDRIRANFTERLGGENWELIAIPDARSLCEGYNRGVRQSRGDILIFAHDDIEILSPDFRHKLKCYLDACDLVGVAGTRRLIGPSWVDAGWPWLHGQVGHPDGEGFKICLYGVDTPLQMDIQALDGLFFACRREVAETVGFDEQRFDGFHFYDLDFTFSAYRAGFRLGVANDIAVIHYSEGNYDAAWKGYAQRFLDKHGPVLEKHEPAKDLRILVQVETRQQVLAFCNMYVTNTYPGTNYADWIRVFDTPSAAELARQRAESQGWADPPLISLLMPVYDTPEAWLRRAIESVLGQTWPHWELCIADDASSAPHVKIILDEYRHRDARIKVVYRSTNGHISAASNSALELAAGEYTALLDHDDELAPTALYWVAREIAAHPDCVLIYSDEDKITSDGKRKDAYFKPDWNPDLFLAQNTLSHLGVYRTEMIHQVGGFRIGYEGSQDYDLALRIIERIGPEQIRHIPRILYHWRAVEGSTAATTGVAEKPYAVSAALRAIAEHLARTGSNAEVSECSEAPGSYRVRYRLPETPPLISLIIPTRNGLELLRQCVDSILAKTRYPNYEILIVDNGSDDPATLDYLAALETQRRARIRRDPRPFNYSALNNAAVREARGELIGLLNNDLEVISPDWLDEMVSHALRPEIGAVGARLWYPDDTLQHAGVILVGGVAGHAHKNLARHKQGYFQRGILLQNFSAVTAACVVMRKTVFEEAGGLDEAIAVAFNDVDLCLKVRALGYRNLWTPYAELYHHESATRGNDDTPRKRARFAAEQKLMQHRWGALLRNDPAYNPNLTLERENFTFAWPPRTGRARQKPKENSCEHQYREMLPVVQEHRIAPHQSSVDIIVCIHNALADVQSCLSSLIRRTLPPYRLILVDDGSGEVTRDYLRAFAASQDALLIRNEAARGYTFAANQGLRASSGDYVVLLNSDTIVTPHWLDRMITCGKSDPLIGMVGPLSNTASWQSVPNVEEGGDWAVNNLPRGISIDMMATQIAYRAAKCYPRIPFLNGFCLLIKRELIEELGYFDEENFGRGYGEENDYCLRARKAGWELAVADDTYIYHAQSKSYSHDRRKQLCELAGEALAAKHGSGTIEHGVETCRNDRVLAGLRSHAALLPERFDLIERGRAAWEGKQVLFVLPVAEAGGGANIVFSEARAMIAMGVNVQILNFSEHRVTFEDSYPKLDIPVIYIDKADKFRKIPDDFDAIVATANQSVEWLAPLAKSPRQPILAYYVQDFEPYFFPEDSAEFRTAWNSYTAIPGLRCLTKTAWNRDEVLRAIGVDCAIVGPSYEADLFRPRNRPLAGPDASSPIRICAMVRPTSPRRAPLLTMQVLRNIQHTYPDLVEIHIFGCFHDDPKFHVLPQDFSFIQYGSLTPAQMAALLNHSDIFADFSSYQAMGLTAMEAMGCGTAVIVPQRGGATSFAHHEENALLIDTASETECYQAVERLVLDDELRQRLQHNALRDITRHHPESAAFNILQTLFGKLPSA